MARRQVRRAVRRKGRRKVRLAKTDLRAAIDKSPLGRLVVSELQRFSLESDTLCTSSVGRPPQGCLLQALLENQAAIQQCSIDGSLVEALTRRGFTLRIGWPFTSFATGVRWVGIRLFLFHGRLSQSHSNLASVVSSRLGRQYRLLPQWPHIVMSALSDMSARHASLLLVPGATLTSVLPCLAKRFDVPTHFIDLSYANLDIDAFIRSALDTAAAARAEPMQEPIFVSGELALPCSSNTESIESVESRNNDWWSENCLGVDDALADLPIADRLAFTMCDLLYVAHARPRGCIDQLLTRAHESSWSRERSVFAWTAPQSTVDRTAGAKTLGSGVGKWTTWCADVLVDRQKDLRSAESKEVVALPPRGCLTRCAQVHGLHQVAAAVPMSWTDIDTTRWPFLAHCTRAGIADDVHQLMRTRWAHAPTSALSTLLTIVQSKTLYGSNRWNRTNRECISFSAVPLPELIARRRFQSHLGRWDWEPYGLLIRRDLLKQLGARPVVYGDESTFAGLPTADQCFFQPVGKKQDWSQEREWRLAGQLHLDRLPAGSLCLFVSSRKEALQLARLSRWSVLWTDSLLTSSF